MVEIAAKRGARYPRRPPQANRRRAPAPAARRSPRLAAPRPRPGRAAPPPPRAAARTRRGSHAPRTAPPARPGWSAAETRLSHGRSSPSRLRRLAGALLRRSRSPAAPALVTAPPATRQLQPIPQVARTFFNFRFRVVSGAAFKKKIPELGTSSHREP